MINCTGMKLAKRLTERGLLKDNASANLSVEVVAREVFANHPAASGSFDDMYPSGKEMFYEAAEELLA